jgi:hypothetical protein
MLNRDFTNSPTINRIPSIFSSIDSSRVNMSPETRKDRMIEGINRMVLSGSLIQSLIAFNELEFGCRFYTTLNVKFHKRYIHPVKSDRIAPRHGKTGKIS